MYHMSFWGGCGDKDWDINLGATPSSFSGSGAIPDSVILNMKTSNHNFLSIITPSANT